MLNAIRRPFFKDLGVRLVGPGGVALYPFGSHQYVLYNMNDSSTAVALRLPAVTPEPAYQERMHAKSLSIRTVDEPLGQETLHELEVGLTLRPFEIALVESRKD